MTLTDTSHSARSSKIFYVTILVVAIFCIAAAGYAYIRQQHAIVIEDARHELETVSDLKAAQLVQWRKERHQEAQSIHANAMVAHRIKDFLGGVEKETALREINSWMVSLHAQAGYNKMLLFRADGEIIVSVSDSQDTYLKHYQAMVKETIQKRDVIFSDFHHDNQADTIDIDLFIPIIYKNATSSECIAVLVIDINPFRQLYPLIRYWPTPSNSAEALLVKQDGNEVLFLSQLRYQPDPVLTFRRPLSEKQMPAVRAALGEEGVFEGSDYRGVPVLAAVRKIPNSPWAIIAKVDTAEILEPVAERIRYVVAICLMMIVALGLGINLGWSRKKTAYLHQQYEAELKLTKELRDAECALQDAHDKLEQRVADRTLELSDSNSKLREETEERLQLQQQLMDAKKLESIGQLAAGVAHEVRNPLNAILSISEALFKESEIEGNPIFVPYIEHIRTQVKRLARLMNELLELGKPIPPSSLESVHLFSLCRDTITLWNSSGAAPKIPVVLTAESDPSQLYVTADALKLQQSIFNLLENASQNSPDRGTIKLNVAATESADTACVLVIDSGKGIKNISMARIFEPFYTERKEGTGLGLALVRHFIQSMGGSITIDNNDPSPGCTATLRIPQVRKEQL
jgi:signal transduction histidine kinase